MGSSDQFLGSTNFSNNFRNTQSSYIREGESINTNVTCPGATLALGLIYFNSCDKLISEWFQPPDSAFLLDSIRPDFLLLRVISRNLIMWKYVLPTQEWIYSQLSTILKTNIQSDPLLNEKFADIIAKNKATSSASATKSSLKKMNTLKSTFVRGKSTGISLNRSDTKNKSVTFEDELIRNDEEESESDEDFNSTCDESDSNGDDHDEDATSKTISNNSKNNNDILKFSTDEDDNVIINKDLLSSSSKPKKVQFKKKSKNIKKVRNLLSDIIDFEDIDDNDFYVTDESELKSVTQSKKIQFPKPTNTPQRVKFDFIPSDDDDDNKNEDSNGTRSDSNDLIDEETKLEAFRHLIAGACMSMGLKFAGSFNKDAYETLVKQI
jgi:hypothetical protein